MTLTLLFSLLFTLEAHRGLSNLYPENTILAFEKAAQVPVYGGMETDVQMTSDGVLVCMHDNTIDRTTNGTGKVSDYTFKQLRKLRIDGGKGIDKITKTLRIPRFKDYLKICRKAGLTPYVELKQLTAEGVAKTIEAIHSAGFKDDEFVLTSFKLDYLLQAMTLCKAKVEYMQGSFTEQQIKNVLQYKDRMIIRPSCKKLTKEFAVWCQSLGFRMEAYGLGVGDRKKYQELCSWGIEGVTCNDWQGLGFSDEGGTRSSVIGK